MIDVTNPPSGSAADPTGENDSRAALQAMIDNNLGVLHFPKGKYLISDTLEIPDNGGVTGHHFVGSGLAQLAHDGETPEEIGGGRSTILWGGEPGGTMIKYYGTGLVWNGLSLWGQLEESYRAGVGIEISRPAAGPLETGKTWFPQIHIGDCDTGIVADASVGGLSADSCAFGYYWPHFCGTALKLKGAAAMMFTFRYVHPLSTDTVFEVTDGGRIYVHSINIVAGVDTVLDIQGGDVANSFFHINGLTGDGTNSSYHLLKNSDSGDGLTHVRFTNGHLTTKSGFVAKMNVNRSQSTNGQTVVEMVGCRGLSAMDDEVEIDGASASKKSRLIIRDCELADNVQVVDSSISSHFTDTRIKNWLFNTGLEAGTEYSS